MKIIFAFYTIKYYCDPFSNQHSHYKSRPKKLCIVYPLIRYAAYPVVASFYTIKSYSG